MVMVNFDTGRHPEIDSIEMSDHMPFNETINRLLKEHKIISSFVSVFKLKDKTEYEIKEKSAPETFAGLEVVTIYTKKHLMPRTNLRNWGDG